MYSLYLPPNTAFSQEILNSILAVTGNEKNCDSLGSMLPQYMALSICQFVTLCVCVQKNFGHFYARWETEIWYVDCSHKYKIN